jgi:lipid II:glycine glycyltransferase (peptidoglycan interpeptide bridge formation enzyme)
VCRILLAGRSLDDIRGSMNQQWRRNVAKAERSGVKIVLGGPGDLTAFHALYTGTAARDGFVPRPLAYFRRMWAALAVGPPDRIRLYLAHHHGDLLAAAVWLRVGGHVWYAYGASADHRREVRASNAVQWRMICDAHELGVHVYDLRGIADTLDADAPLAGLLRFKAGAGAEAVEYLGEWDYPLNRALHRAFQLALERRRVRTPKREQRGRDPVPTA